MRTVLFNVSELDVAKRLGLSREQIRELRTMSESQIYEGEDWEKVGRDICYSSDGIAKLRQIIEKHAPDAPRMNDLSVKKIKASAAATSASLGAYLADRKGMILDAEVTKIYPHNPQYLEAMLGDKTIVIRVNNNANFIERNGDRPGTIIPSRQLVMKNERVFDFVGRCPRARGKW